MTKKQENKVTFTRNEALTLYQYVDSIKTTELEYKELSQLVDFIRDLKSNQEKFVEIRDKIIKDYGIKVNENNAYDFSDNEKSEEIQQKLEELSKEEITIQPVNFIEQEKFFKCVAGLNINVIERLEALICKK